MASKPLTPRRTAGYLVAMGAVLVITTLLLQSFAFFRVYGTSMDPGLKDGEMLVISREDDIKPGQIIIFPMPVEWEVFNQEESGRTLVKRVWAGPGDTFAFDGTSFLTNDVAVGALPPYPCPISRFTVKLGPRQVFVAGDNAIISLDSRRVLCNGRSPYVDLDSVRAHGRIVWRP